MSKNSVIERVFQPLYDKSCWNVSSGYGSFLTLEFGDPHLVTSDPEEARPEWSASMRKRHARRRIHVRGKWHLWIYCCQWNVFTGDKLVGDSALESSSKRRIVRGAKELDGQKLVRVEIDPAHGGSAFTFDLGSRLETAPYDTDSDQWKLYEPSGKVFCYRADGMYSHQRGSTPPSREKYQAFIDQ